MRLTAALAWGGKTTDMRRHRGLFTAFGSVCAALLWIAAPSAVGQQATPGIADVQYATSAAGAPLLLDLYLPSERKSAPLLVWLHGGAWERGSKRPMPLGALVERGYGK